MQGQSKLSGADKGGDGWAILHTETLFSVGLDSGIHALFMCLAA